MCVNDENILMSACVRGAFPSFFHFTTYALLFYKKLKASTFKNMITLFHKLILYLVSFKSFVNFV